MTVKHLSAASFLWVGATTLSAQSSTLMFQKAGVNETNLGNLVGQLSQNALVVLVGMVLLMGIIWLFCICKACATLNKRTKNAHTLSLSIVLCVATNLSMLGSSCTATQRARVTDIQAALTADGNYCACPASPDNRQQYGYAGMYNQYPRHASYNGKPFCRRCGQRIYDRNR